MITEDYVSFETTKLMKEKGFDVSCFRHYIQKNNDDGTSEAIAVCTQSMALKWLRDVYNLYIGICFDIPLNMSKGLVFRIDIVNKYCETLIPNSPSYTSYNEAVEAAIQYCLTNLI